jgi:hypothetical protein
VEEWRETLPGSNEDKDALLQVYFVDFAKSAIARHAAAQGCGIECPGPGNSVFLISFPVFSKREIEIMILDVR